MFKYKTSVDFLIILCVVVFLYTLYIMYNLNTLQSRIHNVRSENVYKGTKLNNFFYKLLEKFRLNRQPRLYINPNQMAGNMGPMVPVFHEDRKAFSKMLEASLAQSLKYDKGTGCDLSIPTQITLGTHTETNIQCNKKNKTEWIVCNMSSCSVDPTVWTKFKDLNCTYENILYVDDYTFKLGPKIKLENNHTFNFNVSDHVKVTCKASLLSGRGKRKSYKAYKAGYRPVQVQVSPPGRENTYNVLLFVFDSTSRERFLKEMPKTVEFLQQNLDATIFQKYHVIGDGTSSSLLPLLTGRNEHELPEFRKDVDHSDSADSLPLLFYKLTQDGYRTAFFEDTPWIGSFTSNFNGFKRQPTDHYLRSLFMASNDWKRWAFNHVLKFCKGPIPRYQFVMDLTNQFYQLDGKKFSFTFISDITNDALEWLNNADEPFKQFLISLGEREVYKNTLLIVVGTGDQGVANNFGKGSLQGKYLERLPFLAIKLPDDLISKRPSASSILRKNAEVLTTPHDVYATILDALDLILHMNTHRVNGSELWRGLTLLEKIPRNRSCSEAGIGTHWCACAKWRNVPQDDPMYYRAATSLLNAVNFMTDFLRKRCALRDLTEIHWVRSLDTGKKSTGFFDLFKKSEKEEKIDTKEQVYQVRISVGPKDGIFEATLKHFVDNNEIIINPREITRINGYNDESQCIRHRFPLLKPYCYCLV